MRTLLLALAWLSLNQISFSQQAPADEAPPNAASIMARVAINQDQSVAERMHYLYVQHARVISRKGNTVQCEEITDTRVTPTETASKQYLIKLDGKLLVKHHYVSYTDDKPVQGASHAADETGEDSISISLGGDSETDRELVEQMRRNFTNDRSRDGIGAGLFPLTSQVQRDYEFRLLGQERINGRAVFHISFTPRDKSEFSWKGDAYIDTTAFQPVLVRTAMSRKIPFAVRTLLGTGLPGLGFTVAYAPQAEGVWFPVSFGTEFKIRVLFLFSRQVIIDADNRSFQRTLVRSTVLPGITRPDPPSASGSTSADPR